MSALVQVESVTKEYRLGNTTVSALRGVSITVERGEFFVIAGPSGSGKTTLLNLVGCLETPSSGSIRIDGVDTTDLRPNQLADIRAHKLSFVFQNFNLLPVLTALENVEFPLQNRSLSKRERRQRAEQALANVGLASHLNHKPLELSGGQRQRVAVARAIVTEPALILADEPTANLDQKTGTDIIDLMKRIGEEKQTTFVFSTHDKKIMDRASRMVHLCDGRLE